MMEKFEEARSIRRKTKKEGKNGLTEAEKRASQKLRIEKELEEVIVAERIAKEETEKFNTKISEGKKELRNILYNSEMQLNEKARRVAEIKTKLSNYEFVVKQATDKWARLTNKRQALERNLAEIIASK